MGDSINKTVCTVGEDWLAFSLLLSWSSYSHF